ncbi:MAG: beta-ketoacyl synthase chain length factor [Victivallaceae bacterium]|nr:beta-ketoacyl synthase chain length factor [Victivallaceae bacterium]
MMFISGIGFISGEGIGLQALRQTCASSSPAPEIDDEIIKSYKFPRDLRRADRFSRLCMIAGNEALKGSDMETDNCGIIVVTALGPHETTFSFLGDLIDYSGAEVSPTKFSHSVHNAAAAYTSIFCGIDAFSLTVVGFDNSWAKGLLAAEIMLEQQQADKVLLIGADEKKTAGGTPGKTR